MARTVIGYALIIFSIVVGYNIGWPPIRPEDKVQLIWSCFIAGLMLVLSAFPQTKHLD